MKIAIEPKGYLRGFQAGDILSWNESNYELSIFDEDGAALDFPDFMGRRKHSQRVSFLKSIHDFKDFCFLIAHMSELGTERYDDVSGKPAYKLTKTAS